MIYHCIYKRFIKIMTLIVVSLVLFYNDVLSEEFKETTIDKIEKAYMRGQINYENYLINLVYLVFNKRALAKEFLVEEELPLKCGNPIIEKIKSNWSLLTGNTKDFILRKVTMPAGYKWDASYTSPGGKFLIHYYTSGDDAPSLVDQDNDGIPDYIGKMAEYFDYVWNVEIATLGYREPDLGRNGKLDIYVENLSGVYGYVWGPDSLHMDNDYIPSPKTDDPDGDQAGIMKVTAAHEFHHECQLKYKITKSWYKEATSTWIEDVVYDTVNDYLHYIGRFLQYPYLSLDLFESSNIHQYGACIFNKFLSEKYNSVDIVRKIWEENTTSALDAIDFVLQDYNSSLDMAFSEFVIWNWFTGNRHNTNLSHYEEASMFPITSIQNRHYISSDIIYMNNLSVEDNYLPDHLGCNYLFIENSDINKKLMVDFYGNNSAEWSMSIIKNYGGSSFQSEIIELDKNYGSVFIPNWKDIKNFVLIPFVLTRSGSDFKYNYSIRLVDYGLFIEKYSYFDLGNVSDGYITPGENGGIVIKIVNYEKDFSSLKLILRTSESGIEISDSIITVEGFPFYGFFTNDDKPFVFHIDENYSKTTALFRLNVVESDSNIMTFNLTVNIGYPEILLIDNSGSHDKSSILKKTLDTLGFNYDYKNLNFVSIDSLFLHKRKMVIWFSGDNLSPMNCVQYDSIANFLVDGGRLFITGNNFLKRIKDSIKFYSDIFHCEYVDTSSASRLIGVDCDPIIQSQNDQLWILNEKGYNDRFLVDSDPASQLCFSFPNTEYGGIMRYYGDYRFILADFSITDLYQPTSDYLSVKDLLGRIMNYLLSQNNPPSSPICYLPNKDTLNIYNVNDSLLFTWSRAIDSDNDSVKYILSFKSSNDISYDVIVPDTFYILTTSKLAEMFGAKWDTLSLKWEIIATDDFNTSFSTTRSIVIIKSVNLPPSTFSLLDPGDGEMVYIYSGEDTTLTFNWQNSFDPEGESVSYKFFITDTSCQDTIYYNVLDTNFIKVNKNLFIELFYSSDTIFVKWFVLSTDGYNIIESIRKNKLLIVKNSNSLGEKNNSPKFSYLGNYPNPFNTTTTIAFKTQNEYYCILDIYNIRGQKVKTLINKKLLPGEYYVVWDGKDNKNIHLPSGIYIYILKIGRWEKIGRMLLLK